MHAINVAILTLKAWVIIVESTLNTIKVVKSQTDCGDVSIEAHKAAADQIRRISSRCVVACVISMEPEGFVGKKGLRRHTTKIVYIFRQ